MQLLIKQILGLLSIGFASIVANVNNSKFCTFLFFNIKREKQGSSYVCISQFWGYKWVSPYLTFKRRLEPSNSALMLAQQTFVNPSYLTSFKSTFLVPGSLELVKNAYHLLEDSPRDMYC